jgi:hypothetical protein
LPRATSLVELHPGCPWSRKLLEVVRTGLAGRRNYPDPSRGTTVTGTRKYRALRAICQACPSEDLCCPNADARSVTRTPDEDARDFARECRKTKAYEVSRDKRKKVEMLFAHLKRILSLTRLRPRGPNGARDEFTLASHRLRARPGPGLRGRPTVGRLRRPPGAVVRPATLALAREPFRDLGRFREGGGETTMARNLSCRPL